jgi:transposase
LYLEVTDKQLLKMIKQLIDMPALKLQKIDYSENIIRIYASVKSRRSKCPSCGKYSKRVHDYYYRTINDLPVFQNRTVIQLKTRKFKCGNNRCHRKVFSEQTPDIIRSSRRTGRTARILETFAIELTGMLGSIMSKQLQISVSSSTITRIAHDHQLPEITQPRVLGVDDWAYRKGVSYGTILIDMETSKPIELLPSRDGQVLKDWLLKYNDVKIITRDRANSYTAAIKEACPNAVQIADRFHLLMNLSDALDTYFKSVSPKIRSLIMAKSNEFLELQENEDEKALRTTKPQAIPVTQEPAEPKVDQRLERFNKVKELQAKGVSILRISKNLSMNRTTVRSYFLQETLSPRSHSKSTNIELFTGHILSRLNTNGYIIKDIIEEINGLGFNGSKTQAYHNINIIKENHGICTQGFSQIQRTRIPYVKPLSSRRLARYIGSRMTEITDHYERYYLQTLLDNITELRIVRKLVQIFKTMFARGCGNIRRWIDFVNRSKYKLAGLKTFAKGLLRDIEALENGINMPWSNGAVEGHVNRVKSIKRQMYGRASFELLRKKVILSQSG